MGVRQGLEVVGFLLVAVAAWYVHPAVSVAVLGGSAIWLANFGDWGDSNA